MKAAFPTHTELSTAVTGLGMTIPSGWTSTDIIAGAIQEWERAVGVSPWQASDTATAKSFNATGNEWLAIPPAAAITAVEIGGEAITLGEGYYLPNVNANRPYTVIEFESRLLDDMRDVTVTAKWGYQLTIFEDVWLLVLDLAIARVIELNQRTAALAAGASGAISEVKQADVTIKYDSTAGRSFVDMVAKKKSELARRYRVMKF